jgi:hypothetical protein
MKTISLLQGISGIALAVALLVLPAGTALAQPGELPVTRVVLFTNGSGYFEHAGTVHGTQEIALNVAADQMDDVLQSLVLFDLDGGSIEAVRYASEDPLERILASYPLDLAGNPTLRNLLSQARGEEVKVGAAEPLSGMIIGVESMPLPEGVTRDYLTLSTEAGLRRVALEEIRDIHFERASLREELAAALAAIARYRESDDTQLLLRFSGTGTRRVQVGYVREMPLWKISYRMVLTDGAAELQGWAILDNPTSLDLTDIRVSFVAGQPLSFITDLYAPVYVERPRFRTEGPQAVVPQAAERARSMMDLSATAMSLAPVPPSAAPLQEQAGSLLNAGVSAQATGSQAGAAFEYRVSEPVSIGRFESAMIPIVQQRVPAASLSVLNEAVLPGHPLRAVHLTNDTGLHLAAGTVSVFEDGAFAGNARLADLLPGADTSAGYAVDQAVTVRSDSSLLPRQTISASLVNGVLRVTGKEVRTTTYRFASDALDGRLIAVEHPAQPGYELAPTEPLPLRTDSGYRFGVRIAPGSPGAADASAGGDEAALPVQLHCGQAGECVLTVTEERVTSQQLRLSGLAGEDIVLYLENTDLSEADARILKQVLTLKESEAGLLRRQNALSSERRLITDEQDRIRQNMAALARDSALYQRYVGQLMEQEDALDASARELAVLGRDLQEVRTSLDRLLRSLGEQ